MKKVVPLPIQLWFDRKRKQEAEKKSYHYNAKQAIANGGASFFL
jgi:hypothetical protein